jgi:hypothetical protein
MYQMIQKPIDNIVSLCYNLYEKGKKAPLRLEFKIRNIFISCFENWVVLIVSIVTFNH